MPTATRLPAPPLDRFVTRYAGFEERTPGPMQRREGPGGEVVVILGFAGTWRIGDAARPNEIPRTHRSFVGGLRDTCVRTEHDGLSHGIHVGLTPAGAHALFRVPLHELARTTVEIDEPELVERLAEAPDWESRFAILDATLPRRFAGASPVREVEWAWGRLTESRGRIRVRDLSRELGWSERRLVAAFREHVGLAPKAAARTLRFAHARELAACEPRPSWAEIALRAGYYDQAHLANDFRRVTGLTPTAYAAAS